MARYVVKRLLLMIPTLLGVAVLIFFLMRVVPGDVVELRFAGERSSVSRENLDKERDCGTRWTLASGRNERGCRS
jgi:peptide/nickel transport system permease protein